MKIQNKVKNLRTISVDEFLALDFNNLKDPKRNVTNLVNAIKENGWSFPAFLWNDFVIDGAGRKLAVEALIKEGHEIPEIPVLDIEAKDLAEAKKKALEVSSQYGQITKESFEIFTEDIEIDFDTINLEGIDADLFIEPEEKDDEVPEVPTEPQSKLGDLYELGEHRVLCGDSTKLEAVERLMDGSKAELLFTSPPYADMREYEGGKDLSVEKLAQFIPTFSPYCEYQAVNLGIKRENHEIVEYWNEYIQTARIDGLKLMAWNVWAKQNAGSVGQQSAFIPIAHEWIFVFGRDFKDINRVEKRKTKVDKKKNTRTVRQADGSVKRSSVGKQGHLKEMESVYFQNTELGAIRALHPATFPIDLAQKYIRSLTDIQNGVIDPFLGSGSTLIAAEKTGRICYGMELDPKYVDVIVQRYVDYTGNATIKKNGKEIKWVKNSV